MKVTVVVEIERPEDLEAAVDEDIKAFEQWFMERGNDPLMKPETAILKTFLFFKTRGGSDAKADG